MILEGGLQIHSYTYINMLCRCCQLHRSQSCDDERGAQPVRAVDRAQCHLLAMKEGIVSAKPLIPKVGTREFWNCFLQDLVVG